MRTGLFRILTLALAIGLASVPLKAQAADWQWSSNAGREQVVVQLDPDMREEATVRTSPTSLDIRLSGPPQGLNLAGAAPAGGSLVSGLEPVGNVLRVNLRDPAFGYIVQRRNGSVTLEIFADPLGARWQPSDTRSIALPLPEVPQAPAETNLPAGTAAQTQTNPTGPTQPSVQPQLAATGTAEATPGPATVPQASAQPADTAASPATTPVAPVQTSPAEAERVRPSATATPAEPLAPSAATTAPQTPMTPVRPRQTVEAPDATPPLSETRDQVQGSVQEAVTSPPRAAADPDAPTATVITPAGQGTLVVPRTSGRDVRVNVQVNQPAASPANGTPAGMPGGDRGSLAPLAVSSGMILPVQADPPAEGIPSNEALSTITQRIEHVPVQPEQSGQVRASFSQNVLSTPTAPPPQPTAQETSPAAPASSAPPTARETSPSANVSVTVQGGSTAPSASPAPPPEGAAPEAVNVDVSVNAGQTGAAEPPADAQPEVAGEPAGLSAEDAPERLIEQNGPELRARFNSGGPETWPEDQALSTGSAGAGGSPGAGGPEPGSPESKTGVVVGSIATPPEIPETAAPTGETKPPSQEPEVIYVDEEGNPVPKPLDVNAMLADARQLIQSMQYEPALEILEQVRATPLPPEKREEVLYLISDAVTGKYNGKWLEGYEPIVSATSEAMNANLRSPQVPRALERLGMINLRTGNQQDAVGYFGVLRRKYPHDPLVPEVYFSLGEDQLKRGQYAEAVQSFQVVMQDYPESQAVRNAARYMAEALYKQGHYERAMTIIDFVDRRWPRIYIDDPAYLLLVADTQFRRGRLDDSLQTYWIYYNLLPDSPTNDQLLLNMGTIYMIKGDMDSANALYGELLRKYPDSQYAPLAVLRQGEEGIFEGNLGIEALFGMFSRPNLYSVPEVAYERLLKDYPDSDEAVVAALRMAVWKLWNREYSEAMDRAEQFLQQHGDSPYAPRADEVILRAFAVELAMDLEEQNYDRILSRWERFPQIRGAYGNLDDELRVALARAQINRGNETEGFALLEPFLERPQDPKYGEYVYKLNLARALRNENWQGLIDLGAKVENWKLSQADRNELTYAMAIARENMGQTEEAVPLWAKLYQRDDIPLYQKAYANYFMARDAERRRSIADAYDLNKTTLDLFRRLAVEQPERADPARVQESLVALMDVTEVANRFAEALEWAEEYAPFVPENSPEYSAYRFRLARLYRKMGDLARWQYYLEEIIQREPKSVFGQMAESELRTHQVARDLSRFTPDS